MIALVGAGAVGSLLAAELIATGQHVIVCARRPLDRIVIERAERPLDVAVRSVVAPEDLGHADWAFVALKGPDNPGAAPWLAAAVGPETVVVAVQNGVEHRENIEPGRRLEHDLLTGAVVRAAERHGIEVPLNRAILALLEGLENHRGAAAPRTPPA